MGRGKKGHSHFCDIRKLRRVYYRTVRKIYVGTYVYILLLKEGDKFSSISKVRCKDWIPNIRCKKNATLVQKEEGSRSTKLC